MICRNTINDIRMLFQQCHRGKDHAGSADTALRSAIFQERLLHGV